MQIPLFYVCDTCQQWKRAEDFPFQGVGRRSGPRTRQPTCKVCRDRQDKAKWQAAHPKPRKRVNTDLFRYCQVCHRWKSADEFSWRRHCRPDAESTCKPCARAAYHKQYAEPRRQQISKRVCEYVKSHWDTIYPKRLKRRAAHIVQVREKERQSTLKNLSKNLQRLKTWAQQHPDRVAVGVKRRAAKRRGAPGHYTFAQLQARIAYYGGKCWICGAPYEAIDHVKPIKVGGSNWPGNLRPICTKCNSLKSFLWPIPQRILDRRARPPD